MSLPALERARLDALFDSAARVAQDWPALTPSEPCVLLIEPATQWVVNCDEAPATGFARALGSFRRRPIYTRPGGSFRLSGRTLACTELLARMPASAHVDEPGASRTDLPGKYPWLLLGSLEGLQRYHAAFEHSSTEEWLSVALHEFVHTWQMRAPSFRADLHAIDSHATDPKPLADLYANDASYRGMVEDEYTGLMAAAWAPEDPNAARGALRNWLRRYARRRARLTAQAQGANLLHADSLFTYLEGVARYAESHYLVAENQHPRAAIPGDPFAHGFGRWTGRGYPAMPNRQLDREYYYAIGFHLALLLDRVDPSWKSRIASTPDRLIGEVQAAAAAGDPARDVAAAKPVAQGLSPE